MKILYILQQIYPCILYGLVSVQLTFAMKWLLQGRQYLGLNTVLGYQQIIIVILCSFIDKYFTKKPIYQITQPDNIQGKSQKETFSVKMKNLYKEKKDMFIFSVVYFLNTLSGTKAHSYLPIPMFLALRRTLIFFVFIATIVLGKSKQQYNTLAKASIFLITFGALFAGLQSFDDNVLGYLLCFFNNSLSAVSLQLTKNYNDNQNLSPYQIVVKNSINILPFFFIISFSTGELKNTIASGEIFDKEILFLINYVAILGFFHQFTTNLCSAKCSPLALAVTQSVKDLISTITSLVFFQDMEINVYSIGGLITSFLGSFLFIYNKLLEVQIEYAKKQALKQQEEEVKLNQQKISSDKEQANIQSNILKQEQVIKKRF